MRYFSTNPARPPGDSWKQALHEPDPVMRTQRISGLMSSLNAELAQSIAALFEDIHFRPEALSNAVHYAEAGGVAAFLVIQDGKIISEEYGIGRGPDSRTDCGQDYMFPSLCLLSRKNLPGCHAIGGPVGRPLDDHGERGLSGNASFPNQGDVGT